MIKTIIIDDEQLARELIKNYLKEVQGIEVIAECQNGFEAMKAIQDLSPDLIFLDVEMPKISGFELLELIENPPKIIFSTAFNEFAIKAFEVNAVDYLLKPYSKKRFLQAIEKVLAQPENPEKNTATILETYNQNQEYLNRIVVKSGNKIVIVPSEEIVYLKADDDYVEIHTDSQKLLKNKTLKFYEKNLNPKNFIRTHRSYLLNIREIAHIENYEKDSHIAILKNNSKIPVSKSGYSLLKQELNF